MATRSQLLQPARWRASCWQPLPTRMEQLRRGMKPKTARAPEQPDAEKAAALLDDVAAIGRALAELHTPTPDIPAG
ncbi:hypothetical protein ACFWOJ_37960 [Streptomyces sp. NPDC058439]|uniref:hypothetical protein n=1 Tax=Streptomyces sp. NPDC058439 TaxID=3346500 RepID=UPI0036489E13